MGYLFTEMIRFNMGFAMVEGGIGLESRVRYWG